MGVLESYLAGREARRVEAENQRVNAMQSFMQENGQAIFNGDPNALGQVAQYDVGLAMQLKGMQADEARAAAADQRAIKAESRADQTWEMQLQEWAATKTAEEKAAAAAQIEESVKIGMALPNAKAWDDYMQQNAPDLVGQFGQREAIAGQYLSMAEVLKQNETAAPEVKTIIQNGKEVSVQWDETAGAYVPVQVAGMAAPGAGPVPGGPGGPVSVDPKAEMDLRKEFAALPATKDFEAQSTSFAKLQATAQRAFEGQKSAASDLALIFNFMKTLDPSSTVRETEFAAAAKAGTFGDQLATLVSRIESGELLTDAMRRDFVQAAGKMFTEGQGGYRSKLDDYKEKALGSGLDPRMALQDVASPVPLVSPRPQRSPTAAPLPARSGAGAPPDAGLTPDQQEAIDEMNRILGVD